MFLRQAIFAVMWFEARRETVPSLASFYGIYVLVSAVSGIKKDKEPATAT